VLSQLPASKPRKKHTARKPSSGIRMPADPTRKWRLSTKRSMKRKKFYVKNLVMRLIRETTPDGKCKYAIVRLDKLRAMEAQDADYTQGMKSHLDALCQNGLLEYGEPGTAEECFVIKLKDRFAYPALVAYRTAVSVQIDELAQAIDTLRRFPQHSTSVVGGLQGCLAALHAYLRDLDQLLERCLNTRSRIPN
jgi:hypothetical protein